MRTKIGELLEKAKGKDFQALARLLTWAEKTGPAAFEEKFLIQKKTCAYRVGITGPPGAGKSTLIGRLISQARERGLRVAVIAVDPSSPFSKGAILADRIRYSEHFEDPDVFIRSLGSRGSLGGLSASTYLMLRVLDAVGFDLVLIETVGVGQTELEIMNVADRVAVVLVPESGDSVQAMKAGLLEIADVFVVNKADRPGADSMANELEMSVGMNPVRDSEEKPISVLKTQAFNGEGVKELADNLFAKPNLKELLRFRSLKTRLKSEAQALLRLDLERSIEAMVEDVSNEDEMVRLLTKKSE